MKKEEELRARNYASSSQSVTDELQVQSVRQWVRECLPWMPSVLALSLKKEEVSET